MPWIGAVDLGGTHTRYGLFDVDGGELRLRRAVTGATAKLSDAHSLRAQWQEGMGCAPEELAALVIGIAGPIHDAFHASTSNAAVRLDLSAWAGEAGGCRVQLANDFACEAYAALTEVGRLARPVYGPTPEAAGTRAVLGPGTGLGAAQLVGFGKGDAARPLALASEFGHSPFAFVGREEADFAAFASRRWGKPCVCGDDVVSGRGLACLHEFLTGDALTPEAAGQFLTRESATLRWYARFLGRICGQWALATLCYGGLYLTGGMFKRYPELPTHPAFIEAFFCAPRLRVLERIPLRRYTVDMSGLWGAAWLGRELAAGGA